MKKSESISCGCWSMLLGKHDTTQLKYKTNVKVVKCTALIFSEDVLIKSIRKSFLLILNIYEKHPQLRNFINSLRKKIYFDTVKSFLQSLLIKCFLQHIEEI